MKYFIDFEATQFSQEIISIGCIREDGQTFYALVAPKKGKITPFITNLTGITAEISAGTICIVNSKKRATNTFTSVEAAALWLKENKCESDTYEHFNLENTIKNIEKAIKGGNHYYGMGWRRVNG